MPIGGSQGLHSKVVDTINPSLQEAMDHVFEVFLFLVGSMWIATFLSVVRGRAWKVRRSTTSFFIVHSFRVAPLFLSSRVLPLSVCTKVEDGAIIRLSRLVTVLLELAFLAFGIVSGTLGIPVGLMWHLADVQVIVGCVGLRAIFQSGTRHWPPPS